uniref:Ovule protein n=1 Tax=Heterorhabditis bacteriophora TaxID=37862 RepID=A0A1I7X046_HETBA
MEPNKVRPSSGLKAPSTVVRKESGSVTKSAVSMEKLTKTPVPKKVASASKLADNPTYERKKSTPGTKQSSNSTFPHNMYCAFIKLYIGLQEMACAVKNFFK